MTDMADLFQVDVRTVSEHLGNVFVSGELVEERTVRDFRMVRREVGRATCKEELQVPHEIARQRLPALYRMTAKTIGKHIATAQREEPEGIRTVARNATVAGEGDGMVIRRGERHNLGSISSVGPLGTSSPAARRPRCSAITGPPRSWLTRR